MIEKQIATIETEANIQVNKQSSLISKHNSLNEKVTSFIDNHERFKQLTSMHEAENEKNIAKVEAMHNRMKKMTESITDMDM